MRSKTFDVLSDTTVFDEIARLMSVGAISRSLADHLIQTGVDGPMQAGCTLTITASDEDAVRFGWDDEKERKEVMAKKMMDTLVKQYAPDADTAWSWMRQAHEIGWEWGNHSIGGPSASDPLGQRVSKSIATAFSNDAGVYVGICLIGGAIRWGWFRAAEWGPRGRDLVLSGDRNHHETPIAAIAEYTLIGENTPMKAPPLDDVLGGTWDD